MLARSFASTLLALAASATLASAQSLYPCGTNGAPDDSKCVGLTNPYGFPNVRATYDPSTYPIKGTFEAPTGSPKCVADPATVGTSSPAFWCGYEGATCSTAADCDFGACTGNKCTGYFGTDAQGSDANCIGLIYASDQNGDFSTVSGKCGAVGAYCSDPTLITAYDSTLSNSANQKAQNHAFDATCAPSSFCLYPYNQATHVVDSTNSACTAQGGSGATCFADYNSCQAGFTCVPSGSTNVAGYALGTCTLSASGGTTGMRSRMRRARTSLCPATLSACTVPGGGRGFECIDTTTSLEQCGACAHDGGVDCTILPGVESVGCVSGKCEIWACATGFKYDYKTESCKSVKRAFRN